MNSSGKLASINLMVWKKSFFFCETNFFESGNAVLVEAFTHTHPQKMDLKKSSTSQIIYHRMWLNFKHLDKLYLVFCWHTTQRIILIRLTQAYYAFGSNCLLLSWNLSNTSLVFFSSLSLKTDDYDQVAFPISSLH